MITEGNPELLAAGVGVGDEVGAGTGVLDNEEDEAEDVVTEEDSMGVEVGVDEVTTGAGAGATGEDVVALGGEPTRGTAGDPLSVDATALSSDEPPTKTAGRSSPASRHWLLKLFAHSTAVSTDGLDASGCGSPADDCVTKQLKQYWSWYAALAVQTQLASSDAQSFATAMVGPHCQEQDPGMSSDDTS